MTVKECKLRPPTDMVWDDISGVCANIDERFVVLKTAIVSKNVMSMSTSLITASTIVIRSASGVWVRVGRSFTSKVKMQEVLCQATIRNNKSYQ